MSLARGRPFVVPVTRLIKDCDSWYRSSVGDVQDGPLVSMAVLRRDLVRFCLQGTAIFNYVY